MLERGTGRYESRLHRLLDAVVQVLALKFERRKVTSWDQTKGAWNLRAMLGCLELKPV